MKNEITLEKIKVSVEKLKLNIKYGCMEKIEIMNIAKQLEYQINEKMKDKRLNSKSYNMLLSAWRFVHHYTFEKNLNNGELWKLNIQA